LIIDAPKKAENAKGLAGTFLKLRPEAQAKPAQREVTSGCAICSVYTVLARRGWLKSKGEIDYKNHLMARHGLET
jgi:hypothetical protein